MEIITELKKFDNSFSDYQSIMRNFNFLSPVQDRIIFTSSFQHEKYTIQYALRFKVFVPDYIGFFPSHGYEVKFYLKVYSYLAHDLDNKNPDVKEYDLWEDPIETLGLATFESIYNEVYPKFYDALQNILQSYSSNTEISKAQKLQNFLEKCQLSKIKKDETWPDNFL